VTATQAQKNKQISIQTSPKISTPQVFKKSTIPQRNKPEFAGKPQGWQHWPRSPGRTCVPNLSCD